MTPDQRAAGRFFVRVGQAGTGPQRCENTLPLFSLALILDADGTLAEDARHLIEDRDA
jgi:hypothetical protein